VYQNSELYRNEHVKHQSDCPYVKLNKQDEKEWTIEEMYDLYKKYKIREYVSLFIYILKLILGILIINLLDLSYIV